MYMMYAYKSDNYILRSRVYSLPRRVYLGSNRAGFNIRGILILYIYIYGLIKPISFPSYTADRVLRKIIPLCVSFLKPFCNPA